LKIEPSDPDGPKAAGRLSAILAAYGVNVGISLDRRFYGNLRFF
jgi:hypothetical protein